MKKLLIALLALGNFSLYANTTTDSCKVGYVTHYKNNYSYKISNEYYRVSFEDLENQLKQNGIELLLIDTKESSKNINLLINTEISNVSYRKKKSTYDLTLSLLDRNKYEISKQTTAIYTLKKKKVKVSKEEQLSSFYSTWQIQEGPNFIKPLAYYVDKTKASLGITRFDKTSIKVQKIDMAINELVDEVIRECSAK